MPNEDDNLAIEEDWVSETLNESSEGGSTVLNVIPIDQRIGQLFGEGHNTPQMVEILQSEQYVKTTKEALDLIQQVYVSWREIDDKSELELVDLKNWHIYMRHELLKRTLDSNPRAALAVLESLADLQKVKTSLGAEADTIPIQITLVPAPDPPKKPKDNTHESDPNKDNHGQ